MIVKNVHLNCDEKLTSFFSSVLWKHLIQKHGGEVTTNLDLSSLAKISDGYTPGHMVQVIQRVVTKRRVLQQKNKPLIAAEFVSALAKFDPVFQEEEETLKVKIFFNIVTLHVVFVSMFIWIFLLCVCRTGMQRLLLVRRELRLPQEEMKMRRKPRTRARTQRRRKRKEKNKL